MTITNDNCNCNIVKYNYINDLLRIQYKSNLQSTKYILLINYSIVVLPNTSSIYLNTFYYNCNTINDNYQWQLQL